jgi:hypothetical protein
MSKKKIKAKRVERLIGVLEVDVLNAKSRAKQARDLDDFDRSRYLEGYSFGLLACIRLAKQILLKEKAIDASHDPVVLSEK